MSKIERARLAIAEHEGELANYLTQRRELDAQIQQAGSSSQRAQLQYARTVICDEVEGTQLMLSDVRVELVQVQAQLDALHQQRDLLPSVGAAVARWSSAQAEMLQAADELLAALQQADQAGCRIACQRLLPGGGTGLIQSRSDLGLARQLIGLSMDESGVLSAKHVVTVLAARHDLVREVAA
jgi:chromosome segregation ATPase